MGEFSKISIYPSPFNFPLTLERIPRPRALMHPYTIIPPPPCFTVCWTRSSLSSSPVILLIYTLPSLLWRRNPLSSLKMTCLQCSGVQFLCARANFKGNFLWRFVRRGFFLDLCPLRTASLSLRCIVETDIRRPCSICISAFICGAVFRRFDLLFLTMTRSSFSEVFLFLPGIMVSFTLPFSLCFFENFTHTALTTSHSRSDLPLCVTFFEKCQNFSTIFQTYSWLLTHYFI